MEDGPEQSSSTGTSSEPPPQQSDPQSCSNGPRKRYTTNRRPRRNWAPRQGMDSPVPSARVLAGGELGAQDHPESNPSQAASNNAPKTPNSSQRRMPSHWQPKDTQGDQQATSKHTRFNSHRKHRHFAQNSDAENTPHLTTPYQEPQTSCKRENSKKPQIKPEIYKDRDHLEQVLAKQFIYPTLYDKYQPKAKRNQHYAPKYNKEQFLLASCQFVISSSSASLLDVRTTDQMVDWSVVEEVRVGIYINEAVVCPICLYPPVAAKITRCGHVYCWPCIIHYLALSEKSLIKCPICYENVRQDDLKTAAYNFLVPIKVGDKLSLCLMRRHRYSTLIEPATVWKPDTAAQQEETLKHVKDTCYQKILVVSRDDIFDIVNREELELQDLLEKERDTAESCFIEAALELIVERKNKILLDEIGTTSSSSWTAGQHPAEEYNYFYQSLDGQNIFLHWLNVRMLLHEYGSWESNPSMIVGKVLELEHHSMTKELRNHLRYLKHLPLFTCFTVAELELENVLLSPETLDLFQKDIKNRKLMRTKKAKNQKRVEKEIEKRCRNVNSSVHAGEARANSNSPPPLEPFEFPSLLQEEPAVLEQPLNSFAEMLKSCPTVSATDSLSLPTSSKAEFPSLVHDESSFPDLPTNSPIQQQSPLPQQVSFSEILKSRTPAHTNHKGSREEVLDYSGVENEGVPGQITFADCFIQRQNVRKMKNKKRS